jgi:hypothetical protein
MVLCINSGQDTCTFVPADIQTLFIFSLFHQLSHSIGGLLVHSFGRPITGYIYIALHRIALHCVALPYSTVEYIQVDLFYNHLSSVRTGLRNHSIKHVRA